MTKENTFPTGWYNQVKFLVSAHTPQQLPQDNGVEVAFAGRSNSGKSRVINSITGKNSLARISKTPGRTRLLNFFEYRKGIRLVDLPGYGYAKVPAKVKQHWARLLNDYLENRASLQGMILIMDIRHPMTIFDEQMLAWCQAAGLPVHILLNKSDKLSRGAGMNTLKKVEAQLTPGCNSIQLFSALKQTGVEEARSILVNWLRDLSGKAGPISD
jgi:GTP-binding protein